MLTDWSKTRKPEKEEINSRYKEAVAKLEKQQITIKEKNCRYLFCLRAMTLQERAACLEGL